MNLEKQNIRYVKIITLVDNILQQRIGTSTWNINADG